MEHILYWLHRIAEILYFVNPIAMIIATLLWIRVYLECSNKVWDMNLRFNVIEKQIDYLISKDPGFDPLYISDLRKFESNLSKSKYTV